MAEKARHAFGSEKNISKALADGVIDTYDILFLDEKKVGWVTRDGEVVIAEPDLSGVEAELATKANAEEVEELGNQIATKADATEVDKKINTAVVDSVASAKAYTDGKVEAAINEHMAKKFEVTNVPVGTLVDYRDKEIRVMCPTDAEWSKQSVGEGGDANSYYMTFKTYVPNDNVVGYIEHLGNQVDSEVLTAFSTDEYGRRYQPTWLALAKYDEATDTWNYYGKNSTGEKYIGWDYQIDWYDVNGVIVASDTVRINLSNEQCHSSIEPYYVGGIMKEVDTRIEEKIAEANSSYEIVEF